MKEKIYKNRRIILYIGIILTVLGIFLAYYRYGKEPWETVGGFFTGFGIGVGLLSLGLKDPAANQ
ncbi:hypothetical protein BA195_02845 [Tenacibaculum soleae]|uniref:Uncharacterized protein n=1 Tax=Tenacibaculum soleae TaxID=447689 RepID=A0A1B9Y1G5_9FLAO|nr:hypothetical protein [Tenacibaculum soleae]MDO6743408.1 hypothetical protein [Tenacibaculum soleae]OCK43658.1 hypothetical protein BA195_02845 [Tenacibaculum soleae]